MSQHNVNFAAQKTQESSTFNDQGSFTAAGELAGEEFFAPVSADLVDNLIGRYTLMRSTLTHISEVIREGVNAQAVAHFIKGNSNGKRGYIMPVDKIFELPREPVTTNPYNRRFKSTYEADQLVFTAAENVLVSLGGVRMNVNALVWYEFDYDPTSAIEDIILSGGVSVLRLIAYRPE